MARRPSPLERRAHQIAGAAAPSEKLIERQYNRQIAASRGWAKTAADLLRQNESAGSDAYQHAVSQQGALDEAARSSLAALGSPYAGAAVAQQGTAGSAMSALLAGQAASVEHAAQQPGIALARGNLAATGLQHGLEDALAQRSDAIQRAYPAILQQLQETAWQHGMANRQFGLAEQQFGLQQAQFGEQKREFGVNAALQREQLHAQSVAASASEWRWAQGFRARYGVDPYTGRPLKGSGSSVSGLATLAKHFGITTNELVGWTKQVTTAAGAQAGRSVPQWAFVDSHGQPMKDAHNNPILATSPTQPSWRPTQAKGYGWAQTGRQVTLGSTGDIVNRGVPFPVAVQRIMQATGLPEPIIVWQLGKLYAGYLSYQNQQHPHIWAAVNSYLQWMRDRGAGGTPVHDTPPTAGG